MRININAATAEELREIPGVGEKVAGLIIRFRYIYGVVKKEALSLALRGNLSEQILDMIDFSDPKSEDLFNFDIESLPSVPKTDVWEHLRTFTEQTSLRSPEQREMWQPPGSPLNTLVDVSASRQQQPSYSYPDSRAMLTGSMGLDGRPPIMQQSGFGMAGPGYGSSNPDERRIKPMPAIHINYRDKSLQEPEKTHPGTAFFVPFSPKLPKNDISSETKESMSNKQKNQSSSTSKYSKTENKEKKSGVPEKTQKDEKAQSSTSKQRSSRSRSPKQHSDGRTIKQERKNPGAIPNQGQGHEVVQTDLVISRKN